MSNRVTLHDRFAAALALEGCTVDPVKTARTRKYTVLNHPNGETYYLGKSGGLRCGRTISESWGVCEEAKAELLASLGI